ncbi:drebrin-like protein isoform X1 [Microcaecilia unicolor]|uniref:Drebrin-like protein isoform X1 n=1 Tax=Microcaecilia unicolor TaxID=1415580 RepID=A0A6P7XYI3_9AMPH|nr:drebrin-like protein isoform X1 [Microcaecilia unicolor]
MSSSFPVRRRHHPHCLRASLLLVCFLLRAEEGSSRAELQLGRWTAVGGLSRSDMAVNLSKNGTALQAAYKDVVDERSKTNWALFTYEGNSNDIRLAGTGDGGLEELVDELNSGKVMYAFCRVKDPNSGLPKYVLINWTGEGVNDARKGVCANHVSTIANFLKGAHVTVNARAEEDVEPESIMEKVAKASGANYNFHKESSRFQDSGPQGPVGSVYQKTNAVSEIKRVGKDTFWAKAEKDEENRRLEEKRRIEEERQRLDRERRERDQKEAEEREKRFKERANQIDAQKKFQQQQETVNREKEKQQWREQEEEHQARMQRGFKRSESVEKAQEAASVISQRSQNPRELFKQKERAMSTETGPVSIQPGKLRSPFLQKQMSQPDPLASPASAKDSPPTSPGRVALQDTPPTSPVRMSEPHIQEKSLPRAPQDMKEEARWQEWHDVQPSQPIHSEPQEENLYEVTPDIYEDTMGVQHPEASYETTSDLHQNQDLTEKGLCARALYDYQAADDTEISFDPDNIITGIEMIDEGWWRGYGPDGHFGMFPANYVELIQ